MSSRNITAEVTGIGRVSDVTAILGQIERVQCCSVVGVSNIGKSALLRGLLRPQVLEGYLGPTVGEYLLVYVDLNRMLHMSEQGFYELVLRCLKHTLGGSPDGTRLSSRLDRAYQDVLQPASALAVPLGFNRAITAVADEFPGKKVIFLFDEFDDPLRLLEGRVFLNLRALRDQYADRIAYVTATGKRLDTLRDEPDVGVDEFCELFAAHTRILGPLHHADARALLARLSERRGLPLSDDCLAELVRQAGGHPGLLAASAYCAARELTYAGGSGQRQYSSDPLTLELDADPSVRAECAKLWNELSPSERRGLEEFTQSGASSRSDGLQALLEKGLLRERGAGLEVFSEIWRRYVLWKYEARRPTSKGVRMDVQTSEVWVNGRPVPYLAPLEYRLLMVLYGRLGTVCTKQEIVEAVYGRDYMAGDDPALQRLVRRLRERIEDDPSRPEYVLSVRGYGYRLVGTDQGSDLRRQEITR